MNSTTTGRCTRRELLRLAGYAVVGVAVPPCLSCSSGPTPEEVAEQARQYSRDFECTSTSGLFPAEVETRAKNEYKDRSDNPLQYCFNCTYFQPPPTPNHCGTCVNVKGPIHPLGHCNAWTAKR